MMVITPRFSSGTVITLAVAVAVAVVFILILAHTVFCLVWCFVFNVGFC